MTNRELQTQVLQTATPLSVESWKTGFKDAQDRREAYLEWLLVPEAERKPPTKAQLAEELGVSTQTLRNYAKDPWVQRELIQRGRALARVERAQDVLTSLYAQAKDPANPRSVQAAKVFLEWISKTVDDPTVGDLADLSDEELEDALLSLRTARHSETSPPASG